MPRQSKLNANTEAITKASSQDELSRWRLGELGVTGLSTFNGITYEEVKRELNHPESINTYNLMSYHPAVNAPLNLFDSMVSKADFRFIPPKDATEDEKNKTAIVASMFEDMDHSLEDFLHAAMTAGTYGWAVIEKVYRYRKYSTGSVYNDGIVGIKKLSLRSQKSIKKFTFDESGNNVTGAIQMLGADPYNRFNARNKQEVGIPRSKFMLITFGKDRNNPYGTSPLRSVYQPWKYLQAIEELEAMSISKDLNGVPVLTVPIQYMSADASPEQKAQLEVFKNIIRNLQQGNQSGVILPSAVDPESRKELFSINLLTQDGKRNNDLNKVKEYFRTMIFIGLSADILMLGTSQGSSGSFALGAIKNSLTGNAAEGYIRRIVQVINDDLIRDIYSQNGWDISRRCKIDYEGFDNESMDEIGKFFQRCASVGLIARDLDTVNYIRRYAGIDILPDDTNLDELLSDNTTRAGEGGATPFEGTRTSMGGGNNSSDLNLDNAA